MQDEWANQHLKYEMKEELFYYMDVLKDDFDIQEAKTKDTSVADSEDAVGQNDSHNSMPEGEYPKTQVLKEAPKVYAKGRWTTEEHNKFLEALRIHGKNWDAITDHIGSRDTTHIRSHA